jgi:hypothetical protein
MVKYADFDELEAIAYNVRKGYAVITNEEEFTNSINSLYNSFQFWDDMTEEEKKKYGYYDDE